MIEYKDYLEYTYGPCMVAIRFGSSAGFDQFAIWNIKSKFFMGEWKQTPHLAWRDAGRKS